MLIIKIIQQSVPLKVTELYGPINMFIGLKIISSLCVGLVQQCDVPHYHINTMVRLLLCLMATVLWKYFHHLIFKIHSFIHSHDLYSATISLHFNNSNLFIQNLRLKDVYKRRPNWTIVLIHFIINVLICQVEIRSYPNTCFKYFIKFWITILNGLTYESPILEQRTALA